MDFRHLNIRMANNNLAYPLLKDTKGLGLNISLSIWQSYINAILECL